MDVKKARRILGILILVIALAILLWGIWPFEEATRTVPIPPHNLGLPTPEGFLPGLWARL